MKLRWVLSCLLVADSAAIAQDLEPSAYSNSPVGMQLLIAGVGQSRGEVNLDPALPIDNLGMESDFGLVAWTCTLGTAEKSAKVDVVVPYSSLDAHGLVFGEPR